MGGRESLDTSKSTYPKLVERPVGKQIHSIYLNRLKQFTDNGQYKQQGLMGKLYQGRASGSPSVKLSVYSPPDLSRPTFKDATSHKFKETRVGESFGPSWSTHWFRVELTVPKSLADKEHLEFHWDTGAEGLIWTEDGEVVHGLTGGGERTEWILPKDWYDGKAHIFYVEMACNHMFGNANGDTIQPPPPDRYYRLSTADIVAVNLTARQLYIDFWIIGDAAREFPGDSWESHKALQICNEIMDLFIKENGSQESLEKCRELAREYIGNVDSEKVYESGKPALVYGIGHCHIDTCWLWPWAETKRKVARSWSNQCDLMDRYPELRFTVSQAQQYKWLEMYYPSLFDRVKEKIKKGTFIPIGGSWVEHDTNMPSGESLVRQFLYGQRFFESHFGQRCTTFWLPDTFGYSAQLPQLCRLAGMTRFFTQKLSWNNINNFPHTTFNWVSLDGSQVICHMAPSETYTAEAHFGDVKRSITQHKSMDQDETSLLVFGKGDGGGGPTWEHIEKLRRCRGMSDKTGLLPRVQMGNTVDDFFKQLEDKAESGTDFVTWYGELYFELHRGTYTTQSNNKRNNRKSEFMMRDVEFVATLASLKALSEGKESKYKYPKEAIDFMWEGILLCHFHDCLPGSSIEMCYDDSDKLYAEIFATGEKVMMDAMDELGFCSKDEKGHNVALNTLPWERKEMLKVDHGCPVIASTDTGIGLLEGKAMSQWIDTVQKQPASIQEVEKGVYELSNARFKIKVTNGAITSLFDKAVGREVLVEGGKANQLVIFDDKPLYWQAWDVEVYHLESRKELHGTSSKIMKNGPDEVSVATETKISDDSWIVTTISLSSVVDPDYASITIDAEVEWHETMKFLKVEFPVDIMNTEASYECQYGIVKRPTHYNSSWDMAKFEVCCHKWADLSEAGYGVSILNDSKYGFATVGKTMRLSLLRAPKAPDAHADMGRHHIRYAIFPHVGGLDHRTIRAGYAINSPLKVAKHPAPQEISSLMSSFRVLGAPALVLDCVKRGENDDDVWYKGTYAGIPKQKGVRSVICRVYDSLGGKARGVLTWGKLPVKRVEKVNIMEDAGEKIEPPKEGFVEVEGGGKGVLIELRAFEVATYRLFL